MVAAVAVLARPVPWDALDRQPVRIAFLACYPPQQQTAYLNFVATLARALVSPQVQEALCEAREADEVVELLARASRIRGADEPEEPASQEEDAAPLMVPGPQVLLARLELYCDMLASARTGKRRIESKIEAIERLLDPRVVEHFRRLRQRFGSALAAVEGGVCQGCSMRLPWKDLQELRRNPDAPHLCSRCRRFVYCV